MLESFYSFINRFKGLMPVILLAFCGFIAAQPYLLSDRSDQILDTGGISTTASIETVAAPEATPVETAIATDYQSAATTPVTTAVSTPVGDYVSLGSRNISLFNSSNTTIDAGNSVARYGQKFLYAHDTAGFNELAALPVGTRFSITTNGATTNYQITHKITLDYADTARFMNAIVNAQYRDITADLAMMTCAGQYDANLGTKNQRLIAFANRV